jgi:hypothetical protein
MAGDEKGQREVRRQDGSPGAENLYIHLQNLKNLDGPEAEIG